MGRPRKNPTPEQADAEIAALAQEGMKKRRPRTAVLERRLQNVFGEPSMSVRFKDQSLVGRWFHDDPSRAGQIYRAEQLGWEAVTPDMILNIKTIGAHEINPAGQVVRGERGREVLMYMPREDREQIQAAKTSENNRRMRSGAVQRTELLEAMGQKNADTADFLDKRVKMNVDTHDFVETRQITPEALED